jgi:hypothetical protein
MARVVQQQKSNPPYLLILFVFLFLVATVVAVLMYLDGDKAKAEAKRLGDLKTALVGNLADTPSVQAMLEKSKADSEHPPVVGQLMQKNELQTQIIAGNAQSTNAQAQAEQAYALIGSRPGLASAVIDAYGKLATQRDQLQKLETDLAAAKAETAAKAKDVATLGAEREKERADAAAKIAELDAKLAALQEERTKSETALTADRQKEIASRDKTIAEQIGKIAKGDQEIAKLRAEIEGGKNPDKINGAEPRPPQASGKVLNVAGAGDAATVYLGLGQKNRVTPGMSFSVFPASGIPSDPNNSKGKIVVTSVDERSSQCRIVLLRDRNNPILPDDLVYNLFLDRARKFVVVGLFDIYGTRAPDAPGAEEVKLLIQRYGGIIQDEVTTDTDYVVMGEEPAGSKAPPEGATAAPPSPEVEKIKDAYKKARDGAIQYKIPFLNTNRFLNLIGFDPSVTTGGK